MKKNINIFVYGSLREGFFNYNIYLKDKVISSKPAILKGMNLYHMPYKGYPAIIPGNGILKGEIIEVMDYENTIKAIDKMEGYISNRNINNEYHKELFEVELENGKKESCYLYLYNTNIDEKFINEAIYIPDGDWPKYMKNINLQ